MPPFKNIYFFGIILITLIVIILYIMNDLDHKYELDKIKLLEDKYKELERVRKLTIPCDVPNLNDPKSCYFKSNYTCSWNENAQRCDIK
jgi:hypothetical protein